MTKSNNFEGKPPNKIFGFQHKALKFSFQSEEQWPTIMCRLASFVFRLKRTWLSIMGTNNSLNLQFWKG